MRSAAVICALAWLAAAAEYPKPAGFVNDFAGKLSPEFTRSLEDRLAALEQSTSIEISVVTVPSLDGQPIESYATGLFNNWGIGKRVVNNGALFLWAPAERKVRIETGRGLSGILSDAQSKQIVEDVLYRFRNNDFEGGVTVAVNEMTAALESPQPAPERRTSGLPWGTIVLGILGAGAVLIFVVIRRGRRVELHRNLPGSIERTRARIREGLAAHTPAAAAVAALQAEAPPEISTAAAEAVAAAPAAYAAYGRQIEEIALLPRGGYGELKRAARALSRLERKLGSTNGSLENIEPTLRSFRARRDEAQHLLPGLVQAVTYTPRSKFTEAAQETLARAQALAAKSPANWLLIRDLLMDVQNCLDHANGHRLARAPERLWPDSGAISPAMALLFAASVFASDSTGGFDPGSVDSGGSGGGDSGGGAGDFGGFGGGDSGGGGAGGDY